MGASRESKLECKVNEYPLALQMGGCGAWNDAGDGKGRSGVVVPDLLPRADGRSGHSLVYERLRVTH